MSVEYFSIEPANRSTSDSYSYDDGTPTIAFHIADQEKYLIGNSVRLSFDVEIQKADGTKLDGSGTQAGFSSSNGLHSIIQQIDISSFKSNVMLESVRNYNRCVSTLMNCGFSDQEEITDQRTNEGVSLSQEYNFHNVGNSNKSGTTATDNQYDSNYCIPLYTGLLMSQPIFLGQTALKGMKIVLNLAPSNNALVRFDRSSDTTIYKYVLRNVKLIGQYYNPTDEERTAGKIKSLFQDSYSSMMRSQGVNPTQDMLETAFSEQVDMGREMGSMPPYTFNSITGFVDSLNSNTSSHSINMGLSNVVSVFVNFCKSSDINNLSADGQSCRFLVDSADVLAPITKLVWSRNGVLYPYKYDLTSNADANFNDGSTGDRRAGIFRSVVDAVKPFRSNHYEVGNYTNNINHLVQFYGVVGVDTLNCRCAGVGVNFSGHLSGSGQDFRFQPLQFQIDSKVKNSPTNHTLYLFAINRQTITFNNNQVQVIV